MWVLNYKESWALKNWCFWTVVLKKTLESPLDCKEIQPVHPKGDQSGMFIGRTDVEAETPILWPLHVKSWLIGKDPDYGKDWGQEEKGTTEDEMVRWHHWHNGRGFGWTVGVGDEQGGLVCCGSLGCKELDTTEQLNWTELNCYMSSSVSSWPAYRFLRKQVWWSGIPISFRIFHSLLWSTESKPFNIVYGTDVFPVIPLFSLWPSLCWQFDLWFLCLS